MTEHDARNALRELGIDHPSRQLVENWLRTNTQPEPRQTEQEPHSIERSDGEPRPHPSSKSNIEPVLRERGELERPAGRRKAGRPRIQAPWFQAVAIAMSDGTPLRQALAAVGVHGLTARQLRSLYRNSMLTAMRREARQKWLREWGVAPKARRRYACKGGFPLGMTPQMRRIL
jgi:hypothetical protein